MECPKNQLFDSSHLCSYNFYKIKLAPRNPGFENFLFHSGHFGIANKYYP
jgi:hypothetical protein